MARSLRTPGHRALLQVLVAARREMGLTQQALAECLSRPQSYVAKVETGERRLDVVELIEWARCLGKSPGELLNQVVALLSEHSQAFKEKS